MILYFPCCLDQFVMLVGGVTVQLLYTVSLCLHHLVHGLKVVYQHLHSLVHIHLALVDCYLLLLDVSKISCQFTAHVLYCSISMGEVVIHMLL